MFWNSEPIMDSLSSHTEGRVGFGERLRQSLDADIEQDPYRQSTPARMFMRTMTDRYTNKNFEMSYFEVELHDLWYWFIKTAKAIPVTEPAADQLACQVLQARNWGPISRIGASGEYEAAITSTQQRIWTDLPFLVEDFQSAWSSSDMTSVERQNLAGFMARLAMYGIYKDELISCALGSFANALETSSEGEAETIAGQVPVLRAWLQHGGFLILAASARSYTPTDTAYIVSTPGELFVQRDAGAVPGFTVARWDFWKQRLEELQQASAPEIVEQLKPCLNMMQRLEEIIGARSHARDDALKAYF
jgi:hypothetical protein